MSKIKYMLLIGVIFFVNHLLVAQTRVYETFEQAAKKPRYNTASVKTPSGEWIFHNALLYDKEPTDYRPMSPRILSSQADGVEGGSVETAFDVEGLKSIRVGFIGFKTDPGYFQVELKVSGDNGKTWESIGVQRGRYDKTRESVLEVKLKKPIEKCRVKVCNNSAPRLNKLNRINLTFIEMNIEK